MEMTSTRIVPAPLAEVWAALNDPEALKASLPGCESLERVSDDEWRAVMAAKVGPVSARFSGTMRMQDSTPPSGYTLKFEGQGGAAGFANGEARVSLASAVGDQTALTYAVKAQVGGKLAQIGSRLVDGAAAKIADDFFARFSERLAPAAVEPPAAVEATAAAPAGVPRPPAAPNGARGRIIRYVAIIAILIVLAVLYSRGVRF
jgi:carbon monoxide dehydrogenase subunit G